MAANIAIFASGAGTNARNIIEKFNKESINIVLILSNNPNAGVLEIARDYNISTYVTSKNFVSDEAKVLSLLGELKTDLIILAGFLRKIPPDMIKAYPDRIINIHPALLPKYGGRGMYGSRVHEAVISSRDKATGITIHYVNRRYDEGRILFQKEVQITENDTPESIAQKVHHLEYRHYPEVIKSILTEIKKI